MDNPDISYEDAIRILTMAQMSFGMMMPIKWIRKNGPSSDYDKAVRKAIYAMQQMDEAETS